MEELYRKLEKYRDSDYYPFHMPGHKRNGEAAEGALEKCYGLDITEIEEFDNLHQAQGILREEQERAAKLYGSTQSYFLVNGSTCGIISAVFAVTRRGGRILMARNCHKSVYHAVYLRELEAVYLQPDIAVEKGREDFHILGPIEPETVEKALREYPDCEAVIITSPTYEGVVSDVRGIADIAHSHGIPVIVDEAHGAHFGFHKAYPEGSVGLGADLVIHSVHKTLPAMTQAALLHRVEKGEGSSLKQQKENLVDKQKLERYLRIFQTSSPSYVLMASISNCMGIVEREGWERLDKLLKYRYSFLERIKACRYVKIFETGQDTGNLAIQCDPCKLVFGITQDRMTGRELYNILLEKYHLQMEMATADYVLAIMTMMDTQEGWERLAEALIQIDNRLSENICAGKEYGHNADESLPERGRQQEKAFLPESGKWKANVGLSAGTELKGVTGRLPDIVMPLAIAYDAGRETVKVMDGIGRITAEFINLYPPGIPLAVPGERLTEEVIECIIYYDMCRFRVQGMENGMIQVVKE